MGSIAFQTTRPRLCNFRRHRVKLRHEPKWEPSGNNVRRYDEICILCPTRSEMWKSYLECFFLRKAWFLFLKTLVLEGPEKNHPFHPWKPWGIPSLPRRPRDSWHVSCCCVSGSSAAAVCCPFCAPCWWPLCRPISGPLTPPPCAGLRFFSLEIMGGSMGKLIFLNCFLTRTPVFIRFFFGDLHRPTVA